MESTISSALAVSASYPKSLEACAKLPARPFDDSFSGEDVSDCHSPGINPCLSNGWERFRLRLAQRTARRTLLDAKSTTVTSSSTVTGLSFGSGVRHRHHSSSWSPNFGEGRARRTRFAFAYKREKMLTHERLHRSLLCGRVSAQSFRRQCLRAWEHGQAITGSFSQSFGNGIDAFTYTKRESTLFSRSNSSLPGSTLAPAAFLSRVGEAWFLRRWLACWQRRGRRYHQLQIAGRFSDRNMSHLALANLFLYRGRRRRARMAEQKGDAFHARRLLSCWDFLARERLRQQKMTPFRQSAIAADASSLNVTPLNTSYSSSLIDACPFTRSPGAVESIGDKADLLSTLCTLRPPPELRLLLNRAIAALESYQSRKWRTRVDDERARRFLCGKTMMTWAARTQVRAWLAQNERFAAKFYSSQRLMKACRCIFRRKRFMKFQALSMRMAHIVFARRRATIALWRLSLLTRQRKFHADAKQVMFQSQRLRAVTRAMSLLHIPAARTLCYLHSYTRAHQLKSFQRAIRAWHKRAVARRLQRKAQEKVMARAQDERVLGLKLQRWHRWMTCQQCQREAWRRGRSHFNSRLVRESLRFWARQAKLKVCTSSMGRRRLLSRHLLAWAKTVSRQGELRAMELALACRHELLVQQRVFDKWYASAWRQAQIRKACLAVAAEHHAHEMREILQQWRRNAKLQIYVKERLLACMYECLTSWMLSIQSKRMERCVWMEGKVHNEQQQKRWALRRWSARWRLNEKKPDGN